MFRRPRDKVLDWKHCKALSLCRGCATLRTETPRSGCSLIALCSRRPRQGPDRNLNNELGLVLRQMWLVYWLIASVVGWHLALAEMRQAQNWVAEPISLGALYIPQLPAMLTLSIITHCPFRRARLPTSQARTSDAFCDQTRFLL